MNAKQIQIENLRRFEALAQANLRDALTMGRAKTALRWSEKVEKLQARLAKLQAQ